jgi:phage tail-like protein
MATQRDDPYGSFNFLVDFASGDTGSVLAGFQEVTGMHVEMTAGEYRNGNSKKNHAVKVSGMYKIGDITFKRGMMGATDLYSWMDTLRTGDRSTNTIRTVHVTLQDEAHNQVMQWTLFNARPMKLSAPALNAKTGTEVAIEELVLSCEDMTME